jgi:hypothetical protein
MDVPSQHQIGWTPLSAIALFSASWIGGLPNLMIISRIHGMVLVTMIAFFAFPASLNSRSTKSAARANNT